MSLTHVIGFAVVRAMATMPEMGYGFTQVDGKARRTPQRGHEPRFGNRPRERRWHAAVACSEHHRVHSGWTSPLFGPPTKTWSGAPAAANSR